jgi:hypothetical protein
MKDLVDFNTKKLWSTLFSLEGGLTASKGIKYGIDIKCHDTWKLHFQDFPVKCVLTFMVGLVSMSYGDPMQCRALQYPRAQYPCRQVFAPCGADICRFPFDQQSAGRAAERSQLNT